MKKVSNILIFMLLPFLCNGNELVAQLEILKDAIGEVQGEDTSYEQVLNYHPSNPHKTELVQTETDKKGKITVKTAIFNLGLLDKNLISRDNKSGFMWISARSGGMPVIKLYENGELDSYESELQIYSTGVDNAREIEEALKTAIPLSEASWKSSINLPTDLVGLKERFSQHIKNIVAG